MRALIRHSRWFATAAVLVIAGVAHANDARAQLDQFTRGLKGLEGQFTQQVTDGNGRVKETSSGTLALSAPRLFRWEYVKPYPQLIVADGRTVWVYDPDLQQVTRRSQGSQEQDSPLAALIDPAKLDRDFNVEPAGSSAGLNWLQLRPKRSDNAAFERARLGFAADGALSRMEIHDTLGQRTTIGFSGWTRNPTFARDTFRYTPPAGVDVVGEE
ncbi:outer membrane lipoprotein chaperone LolA [Luteimonas deserti]|uniref:Outer-membrane lipoprotein carrier protein n=1 Tax=Luteimonas deserti TaxID=2752306 RepID=A0A7Z0QSX6_9GAMM|nr:outer membrane lipoprotein chaperone LolA [Luteimonas deserti]NYZ64317.1 outer membrane lipoprotein chaperone LolA [Luteimonas deserti]